MIVFYLLNCLALLSVYTHGDANPLASFLLAGAFLISAACFTHAVFAKSLSAVSFSIFLYMTYGFLLAGLMQVRMNQFYWHPYSVREELILDAAVVSFFGMVCLGLGYLMSTLYPRPDVSRKDTVPFQVSKLAGLNMSRSAAVAASIALLYLMYNVSKFGFPAFIGTRHSVTTYLVLSRGAGAAELGLTLTLSRGLAVSSFVIAAFLWFQLKVRNPWSFLALVMACITLSIANFPAAMPRFWLIATLLCVMMSASNHWFRTTKSALYMAAPTLMFFIFPLLASYNRKTDTLNFEFNFTSPFEQMLHGDYDGVQSVLNTVLLVQEEGYALGGRLLSALFFMVPRSIWSGKYEATGWDAAEAANFSFLNISAPLPAEMFADFGFAGVTVGMLAIGWMVRVLDIKFERIAQPFPAMIAIVIAGFAPILARGSLLGVIAAPASALFMLFVWRFVARLRV